MKRSVAILGAVVLVAGACGGGGDDDIAALDGVPSECVDLMVDYLKVLEPAVEDIDWENATMEEMANLGEQIPEPSEDMEAQMTAAGCDDLEFEGGDEESFAAIVALAQREAPGTVGYLTWVQGLMSDFADLSEDLGDLGELTGDLGDLGDLAELTGDVDLGELEDLAEDLTGDLGDLGELTGDLGDLSVDPGGLGALGGEDLPQDCDGAIAYIENLMATTDGTMMDLPVGDMMGVSGVLMTITSVCSVNQMNDFFARPDVTEFMESGG